MVQNLVNVRVVQPSESGLVVSTDRAHPLGKVSVLACCGLIKRKESREKIRGGLLP